MEWTQTWYDKNKAESNEIKKILSGMDKVVFENVYWFQYVLQSAWGRNSDLFLNIWSPLDSANISTKALVVLEA
jgi:hypothetical protein